MTRKNEYYLQSICIVSLIPLLITLVVGIVDKDHMIDRCWPMWVGWGIGTVVSAVIAKLIYD